MSTEDVHTTQTTLANDARVAGRDYFERVDVRRLDDWLALQDDDQRDAISLSNEDVFMKRFRMDLPTPLRSKLLEIKRRGNLTDRRIRHLRSAGVLVQRGDAVELAPSVVGEMIGWSFMVICFLVGMAILVAGANVPLANHCVIRAMPVQDSAACRSIIPRDVGPRFRGKPVQRVRRDNPATLDPFSLLGGGRGGAAEVIRAQDSRGPSSPV